MKPFWGAGFLLCVCILISGCLTAPEKEIVTLSEGQADDAPKHLFVLLDGTRNDQRSATNVCNCAR
jgi:hypothetical protein